MLWIYVIILGLLLILLILSRNYKKEFIRKLRKDQHPLRLFYPAAALIADMVHKVFPESNSGRIRTLLRSLYVKENVELEKYLYMIRKYAVVTAVFSGMTVLGFLVSLTEKGISYVSSVQRGDYGENTKTYDLNMDYRNTQDMVSINVDAVKYTESEILELFERSYEDVVKEMLGENESQDCVTEDLNLITEYNGFDIYWEIEDITAVNYNGDIKKQLLEGDECTVNLYAAFSLDDTTAVYTIPVKLTGKKLSDREQLLDSIYQSIEENNDIHSKTVELPDEIGGYRILFSQPGDENGYLFLILSVMAIITIILFYDRSLESKVKKRQDQMMVDFAEIVSKLSLLYEAGLSIHGAFERIVADYEKKNKEPRYAYTEIKLALEKIKSGVGEAQAYAQLGKRCALYPYIKLGNILEQNLSKGTKGMKSLLKQEVEESFETRKRLARKKGEEAGTKMLLPMIMLLGVVIAIIAVPALLSMGM